MVFTLLRAKEKRSPNRRWILTTMAGNGSVSLSRDHRGFRNGDGSGAFFFTPGWFNGYAVHTSARRVGDREDFSKATRQLRKSPVAYRSLPAGVATTSMPAYLESTMPHSLSPLGKVEGVARPFSPLGARTQNQFAE